jgi:hypothetical protein
VNPASRLLLSFTAGSTPLGGLGILVEIAAAVWLNALQKAAPCRRRHARLIRSFQATVLQGQEITAAIGVRGAKVADIPVERPIDLEQPQRHATKGQQPGI